jgi:hypothetical protein
MLLTLAFLSRSLTLAVPLPHLIAQVSPETIPRKSGFSLRFDAARPFRYEYFAMAVSLLTSGMACWKARKLPDLLEQSQPYKAK